MEEVSLGQDYEGERRGAYRQRLEVKARNNERSRERCVQLREQASS